jgi:HPt (histidine-containing phosphotransfer) domain-containing protein
MDDYLTKPINGVALLALIERRTTGATPETPQIVGSAETMSHIDEVQLASIEQVAGPAEFQSLIRLFVSTAEARLSELGGVTAADLSAVRRVAHDLAGVAGNFGARRLEALSRRLMAACVAGDKVAVSGLLGDLPAAYRAAATALQARYLENTVTAAAR